MENFLTQHLPFWNDLSRQERELVLKRTFLHTLHPDRVLQLSESGCAGLKLVRSGQVRIFLTSGEGEEVNLYRLLPGDICMLSAMCLMGNVNLGISVQAEKDSEVYVIPAELYRKLDRENVSVKNFSQEMLAHRLSSVMSIIGKVTFSSVSHRLADMLIYHSALSQSSEIRITHESLAKDVGTAREVVTRTLRQFQKEGLVSLSRGRITLLDKARLETL